ncbi:hypothetical protein AYJ54_13900 [Bradyrhizobium centrolobii]|uniref:Uncharacterized protein n=1 Tax=Bradyrhizobium centrolobii TaxID=1505087 RepID=A0A176YQK0_9BRAD|nr:hypothetical protein AYJ54_13900 [Bradyrhizobium centrolobii]
MAEQEARTVPDARPRLPTRSQFVALLHGQLSGASALREIVTGLFRAMKCGFPTSAQRLE